MEAGAGTSVTTLQARVEQLQATVDAQQDVIGTLVEAAERRAESITQLGTQHLVEQRTAGLLHAERVLRSVIEALDGALCIVGQDGTILDANRRWREDLLGFTHPAGSEPHGALGSDFFAWCATARGMQHLLGEVATLVQEVIADLPGSAGDASDLSVKGRLGPEGGHRWVVIRIHPVRDHDAARAVISLIDITDGMQAQEQLQQLAAALSQEKTLLAGVISAVPQLVFWKDSQGRYVGCNAAYLAFRGLDQADLLGRDDVDLGVDDAMARALRELEAPVMATGEPIHDRKLELSDSQGRHLTLLLSVLPHAQDRDGTRGVIGVGADITHARELERQLAQANRLESIGQLAAGIAHEINTPIQYVSDNTHFVAESVTTLLDAARKVADLAAEGGTQDDPLRARIRAILQPVELDYLSSEMPGALDEAREGLGRVTEIVRAMKDYAHPGSGRADVDVNRAIESTVQVCRNEWKYVARVELRLDPAAGVAPCFEGELKQVVLNMIVNAAQALAEDRDRCGRTELGTITISTGRTGDDFVITIADDGPGMDEKVRRRVFDPFFTTKEVGKGTGQGLSLAHAVVVTKHQGTIGLDTAPGQGATFTIRLPLRVPESAQPAG